MNWHNGPQSAAKRPLPTATTVNKPADFILAIVEFMGDSHRVHYVRDPFRREPDFGVTSVNYDLAELLARARRDAPAITASSRRRRVSKEQGFGIDRLPRINALRFAHSRKVENPRFNSAETGRNVPRLETVQREVAVAIAGC